MATQIALFSDSGTRKTFHNDQWWFVLGDVIGALTDSADPSEYINDIRRNDNELLKSWGQIVTPLWMETEGGKRKIECVNTEGVFRIIQSISSPKAEAIKRWLAKVGFERVQEIENPELAMERTRAIYKAKGYSDAWIEKRMHGIAVREKLTDEWEKREVKQEREHEILMAEIAKAAFGVTPGEHKQLKGLKQENLRDHMTDLELIFSMLGEAATTEITKANNAQGFHESKTAARKGGEIAGTARKDLEKKIGKSVVSPENYLTEPESRKRLKQKKE